MSAVKDRMGYQSKVVWELRGADGGLKDRRETTNLVTDVGDEYCAACLYTPPTAMDSFKLGTATTAVAKNGAGSFVAAADYVDASAHECDEASPKAGATADIVTFIHTWAAGEATNATLNRIGLTDNSTNAGEADATHTMAIALLPDKPINKGAADTLKVTWNITFLGA